ncbi:MAG: hypothetical protein E3J92_01345 [Dehalococcoidia bacterium]|nr:MAG: hypothetical protein E3J92_01345 [Dehalococcoidia bacterium]
MKWKQFLPVWLVVFLLAPSIWTHTLFMTGTPPPGSPETSYPLVIPFGGTYYTMDFFQQLISGDFADAIVIFLQLLLPIIVYTFFLSWLIYYGFRKMEQRQGEKFRLNWKCLPFIWLAVFLLAPSIWPHTPVHIGGTLPPLQPFGVVHYSTHFWELVNTPRWAAAQIIEHSVKPIAVILVYSFALSVIIQYALWRLIRRQPQDLPPRSR